MKLKDVIRVHCCLILCYGEDIVKTGSSYFVKRFYKNLTPGDMLWSFQTPLGHLFCGTECCKNPSCSFFRYRDSICQGVSSTSQRAPALYTGAIHQWTFKKYVKKGDKEVPLHGDFLIVTPSADISQEMTELNTPSHYQQLTANGVYFKRHNEKKNWHEASRVCQEEGGTLVKLESREKAELYAKTFYKGKFINYQWIGLHDLHDNNTWYWTDGSRQEGYSNWRADQPDHELKGEKQDCVLTAWYPFILVKWNDWSCNFRCSFVCEKN